jgi:insulysin
MGLDIKIQSAKPPAVLEARIETFLAELRAVLADFSEERMDRERSALAARLRERPKNLAEETNRFWSEIESGHQDFLRGESVC